uniref:Uncharacterized protein n=1 Tax=Triticum urartu TaxID=4572 RepID=A0A8R7THD5_TRIUA
MWRQRQRASDGAGGMTQRRGLPLPRVEYYPFLFRAATTRRHRGRCKIRASSAVTATFSGVPLHCRRAGEEEADQARKGNINEELG